MVDKLNAEVRRTLDQPEVQKRFVETGAETFGMSSADFLARIKKDAERYSVVVKAAGVKPE